MAINLLYLLISGMISNIPPGILCDQYGIVGLLSFMKGLEQYPSLSALTIGLDITKLGLNMESTGYVFLHFMRLQLSLFV
jgi:CCR4-NOT transcription complex subunit 2